MVTLAGGAGFFVSVAMGIQFSILLAGCAARTDFVLRDFVERLTALDTSGNVLVDDHFHNGVHKVFGDETLNVVASHGTDFFDH